MNDRNVEPIEIKQITGRELTMGKFSRLADGLPFEPGGWTEARLPELYSKALIAISQCETVDECMQWNRKADAYASYYRQARAQTFFEVASRIRLRALRRCGEIFKEIDANTPRAARGSQGRLGPLVTHMRESGLPEKTVRGSKVLANMPEKSFNRAIDATPVPSLNSLVKTERENRGYTRNDRIRLAWKFGGAIRTLREIMDARVTPEEVGEAVSTTTLANNHVTAEQNHEVVVYLKKVVAWLDRISPHLPGGSGEKS